MKELLAILILIGASESVSAQPLNQTFPGIVGEPALIQVLPDRLKVIEAGVGQVLRDPYTAHFGPVVAGYFNGGTIAVCGLVNAKNSFGGYVGMAPFAGYIVLKHPNDFSMLALAGLGDATPDGISSDCAAIGLNIPHGVNG